jgi:hypothetical protein
MPADPTTPGNQPTIGFDQPAAPPAAGHGERFGHYVLEVELGAPWQVFSLVV